MARRLVPERRGPVRTGVELTARALDAGSGLRVNAGRHRAAIPVEERFDPGGCPLIVLVVGQNEATGSTGSSFSWGWKVVG